METQHRPGNNLVCVNSVGAAKRFCQTKIGQFQNSVAIQQQVIGLQILELQDSNMHFIDPSGEILSFSLSHDFDGGGETLTNIVRTCKLHIERTVYVCTYACRSVCVCMPIPCAGPSAGACTPAPAESWGCKLWCWLESARGWCLWWSPYGERKTDDPIIYTPLPFRHSFSLHTRDQMRLIRLDNRGSTEDWDTAVWRIGHSWSWAWQCSSEAASPPEIPSLHQWSENTGTSILLRNILLASESK